MEKVITKSNVWQKTKYPGVRKSSSGNYEISFYPFKGAWRKTTLTVEAKTDKEAFDKRQAVFVEARKNWKSEGNAGQRLLTDFSKAWVSIERGLIADKLPEKTQKTYKRVYDRIFTDFKPKYFPDVQFPSQLTLPFLNEYKNYFTNDLKHENGWRSELIYIKALIGRFYGLGYCTEEIIRQMKEIKKPKRNEKDFPEISKENMDRLLKVIKDERPDIYKPVFFMYKTGRRVEETTLISRGDVRWRDFEPVGLDIKIETTKTKKKTPLNYLDSELKDLVRLAYHDSKDHKPTYLFLNKQHRKMDQRRITDYLRDTSLRVLGVAITSHYFRHRFMTECQRNGIPIIDAMAVSGIMDIKVALKYYSHYSGDQQKRALETMKF